MATRKRSVRRTSNAPTMQDVARLADVSVATVSAAVNGTATVSRERTQRIEDAIAQVGYQRNAVARSLKMGRTHTVGLTVPDIRNPFFTDVVSAIQRTLNDAGYAVMLCCNDESTAKQDQQIRLLLDRMVDGLIVAPAGDDDVMTELITRARKPAVLIDRSCAGLEIDAVVTDNSKAVFEAVDYLLRLGYRRIGYLSGSTDTSTGRERLAGYRRALSDAGLDYDSALVQHGHFRQDEGYRAAIGLLALPDRPSALSRLTI